MGVCSFVHISYPFFPAWPASLRMRCAQKCALRYGRVFICACFKPLFPSLASLAAHALRAKVCSQVWVCVHLCIFHTPFPQPCQPRCACAVRKSVLSGMDVCSFVHVSNPFFPAWPASLRMRCAQLCALRYGCVFICAYFIPLFPSLASLAARALCAKVCSQVWTCVCMCTFHTPLFPARPASMRVRNSVPSC